MVRKFFIFTISKRTRMPSNDKPSLKDLESLVDSKLKPIHSRIEINRDPYQ